jgi:hypothetical protein
MKFWILTICLFVFKQVNSQELNNNIIKYKIIEYIRQDLNLGIQRKLPEKIDNSDFIDFVYNNKKNMISISKFFDLVTFDVKSIESRKDATCYYLYENMYRIDKFIIELPNEKNKQMGEIRFSSGWLINDIFKFKEFKHEK